LLVPGLGLDVPGVPNPGHPVQQLANRLRAPVEAVIEFSPPGGLSLDVKRVKRKTFTQLSPHLDDSNDLRVTSLPPRLRQQMDLDVVHPWDELVVVVVVSVFADGSLGLFYQDGKTYPVPPWEIAAVLPTVLRDRPFIIETIPLLPETSFSEVGRDANIAEVHAAVARLGGRDPDLAAGSAVHLYIDATQRQEVLDRAEQDSATRLRFVAHVARDFAERVRRPLVEGVAEQVRGVVVAAGNAVADMYALLVTALPQGRWTRHWGRSSWAWRGKWCRPRCMKR